MVSLFTFWNCPQSWCYSSIWNKTLHQFLYCQHISSCDKSIPSFSVVISIALSTRRHRRGSCTLSNILHSFLSGEIRSNFSTPCRFSPILHPACLSAPLYCSAGSLHNADNSEEGDHHFSLWCLWPEPMDFAAVKDTGVSRFCSFGPAYRFCDLERHAVTNHVTSERLQGQTDTAHQSSQPGKQKWQEWKRHIFIWRW